MTYVGVLDSKIVEGRLTSDDWAGLTLTLTLEQYP